MPAIFVSISRQCLHQDAPVLLMQLNFPLIARHTVLCMLSLEVNWISLSYHRKLWQTRLVLVKKKKKCFLKIFIQDLILSPIFYFIALAYQGLSGFWLHYLSFVAFDNLTGISYENLTSFWWKCWRCWSPVLHKHAMRSFWSCFIYIVLTKGQALFWGL